MPLPNVSSTMEKNYHAASQANKSPTSTTSKDYAASLVSTSTTLKGDAASVDSASIMSKDYASTKGLVLGGKEKKSKRAWLIEKIKAIEPPEPRIPNTKRTMMPAWA